MRLDQRGLHVVDRLDGAAELGDALHLLAGALEQLGHQPVHHLRAFEDVGVLEQVGLVGQDLLEPKRPLLVPRPGQAERLVPGRQLDRPCAGVPAERHRERLERDPVDVVLRLGLGQPERVDLDAVAQPAMFLVLDAVALAAELVPQDRHRAELGVLLDEAHAGVDEERDAPEHAAHQLASGRARGRRRARRSRCSSRTRSPGRASRPPPGGGRSRC